jgi:hypothetical protein
MDGPVNTFDKLPKVPWEFLGRCPAKPTEDERFLWPAWAKSIGKFIRKKCSADVVGLPSAYPPGSKLGQKGSQLVAALEDVGIHRSKVLVKVNFRRKEPVHTAGPNQWDAQAAEFRSKLKKTSIAEGDGDPSS